MTSNDWLDIRTYQEVHDNLHEEADDPAEPLVDHIDPSYLICNAADTARAPTFENFWYIATTHFEAESWTNNTVIEFEYLRGNIKTYLNSEDEDEKAEVGQKAFKSAKRL